MNLIYLRTDKDIVTYLSAKAKAFVLIIFLLTFSAPAFSQTMTKNADYQNYIEKYKDVAIKQMKTYNIPASITLAQAVLESGAGKSDLARRSNNHFGIKCGTSWTGNTTSHTDDRANECFRVYSTVEESYEDHSKFLLRSRYQRLFKLETSDYKAWARGLKACGYATSPTYADRLIKLIDLYELYRYDKVATGYDVPTSSYEDVRINAHTMVTNNGVLCVVAKPGDTWKSLSGELSISVKKLLKVNEAVESVELCAGDYVYLEKKRKKAAKTVGVWHKIQSGESMYSISQKYGVRIRNLYKMNYKDAGYTPISGDLLRVR